MNKQSLEKIKSLLEEKRQQLENELASFARKDSSIAGNYLSEYPSFGEDEDENAAEVADYTNRLSLEYTLEDQLKDIKKALEGIKKGTYGICKYCHNEIEEARLLARPVSTSCVSCKKKLKGEA